MREVNKRQLDVLVRKKIGRLSEELEEAEKGSRKEQRSAKTRND
jgi:hypothetical protein